MFSYKGTDLSRLFTSIKANFNSDGACANLITQTTILHTCILQYVNFVIAFRLKQTKKNHTNTDGYILADE